MELVVLIGVPGAGKTGFYRERFAATHELVSKDLMRSARDRSRRQGELIEAALAHRRSVVIDNTNATRAERVDPIARGRAHGARVIGYCFAVDVREALARNAGRSGRARVPDVAVHVIARRLVPPSWDEGWDELWSVRLDERGFHVAPWPRVSE
jgi:predicted kinase